ncbi:MAG: riboflavin biosynthesis protein RibF [Fretibacterium sp.]|nr:riboflavin biosynthesis protein RibF [Fretibacterium sp.]
MIIVMGAFDGFHRGHALLFERARHIAKRTGGGWGVVTFEPHPGKFMGSLDKTLFTERERERIACFLDIPHFVVLKFDDRLRSLSPEVFLKELTDKISVDGVVVGTDFRFGFAQRGDVRLLEEVCRSQALAFEAVPLLRSRGEKLSSTLIRESVEAGDFGGAEAELGYPWFLLGEVVRGSGRGRDLGFPTANLKTDKDRVLPPHGVYAVLLPLGQSWKSGALSIGTNPTFPDVTELRIEVFLLDFEGELYGEELPVLFLERLRPEIRFENSLLLTNRIKKDVERCREICQRAKQEKAPLLKKILSSLRKGKEGEHPSKNSQSILAKGCLRGPLSKP